MKRSVRNRNDSKRRGNIIFRCEASHCKIGLIFQYKSSGFIAPSKDLTEELRDKAKALLRLVGLNRTTPRAGTNDYEKASDRRFENRLSAIVHAYDSVDLLEKAPENARAAIIKLLTDVVKYEGFWSIYMKAFRNHPEVRRRLINALPGTCAECFDENGEPMER